MNEQQEIQVTTKFCHPYMNFGGADGCSDVVLKLQPVEVQKILQVDFQKESELGEFNLAYFSSGLGVVLFFFLFSYGVGQVLKLVK